MNKSGKCCVAGDGKENIIDEDYIDDEDDIMASADKAKLISDSRSICSYPGCESEYTYVCENGKHVTVGEIAHIVAETKKGPRHKELNDFDCYDNLILLCHIHHRIVDANIEEYLIESLKNMRDNHIREINLLPLTMDRKNIIIKAIELNRIEEKQKAEEIYKAIHENLRSTFHNQIIDHYRIEDTLIDIELVSMMNDAEQRLSKYNPRADDYALLWELEQAYYKCHSTLTRLKDQNKNKVPENAYDEIEKIIKPIRTKIKEKIDKYE